MFKHTTYDFGAVPLASREAFPDEHFTEWDSNSSILSKNGNIYNTCIIAKNHGLQNIAYFLSLVGKNSIVSMLFLLCPQYPAFRLRSNILAIVLIPLINDMRYEPLYQCERHLFEVFCRVSLRKQFGPLFSLRTLQTQQTFHIR